MADKLRGKKFDNNKLRWDLIPWRAMKQVVLASMHGARLYGDFNWRKVKEKRRRYWAANMRHVIDYQLGLRKDKDSGLHPLAHAVIDLLFLLDNDLSQQKKR